MFNKVKSLNLKQMTTQFKNNLKNDLKQLWLLLWKNLRLQIRSPIGLALEILVPALFAFILLPIRTIVKSESIKDPITFNAFNIDTLPLRFFNQTIAYQPDNLVLKNLMQNVGHKLELNTLG